MVWPSAGRNYPKCRAACAYTTLKTYEGACALPHLARQATACNQLTIDIQFLNIGRANSCLLQMRCCFVSSPVKSFACFILPDHRSLPCLLQQLPGKQEASPGWEVTVLELPTFISQATRLCDPPFDQDKCTAPTVVSTALPAYM